MHIISPSEKLRKIRTEIGLSQEDLTDNQISRSLISMIETGKRPLTTDTAKLISKKLNHYYKSMGKVITPEYLMESEEEQAKKFIFQQLKKLEPLIDQPNSVGNQYIDDLFKEIMQLAKKWSLQKELAEIFVAQGHFYYNTYKFNDAIHSYSEALEYYIMTQNYKESSYLYNELGKCYYKLFYLDTAAAYYNKAYETAVKHKIRDKIKFHSLFNLILTYYKMKKYECALPIVKKVKQMGPLDHNTASEVLLLESSVYRALGNYEKAEKIYSTLLNKREQLNHDTLALVLANVSIYHRLMGDYTKFWTYINEAIALKDKITPPLMPDILLELVQYYIILKKYDEAIDTLHEAYLIADQLFNNEGLINIFFSYANIYMEIGNYANAKEYIEKAEKIIFGKDIEIKIKIHHLYSYYSELYCRMGDMERCIDYIKKMRNLYSSAVLTDQLA